MSSASHIITTIFEPFQEYINSEQDVREEIRKLVKDIEKPLREIVTTLQVIHHERDIEQIHSTCINARQLFEEVREGYATLDKVVPPGQYYRYNDHWRYVTQRLCFLAALIVFLEKGILINKQTAAEILGVDGKTTIHLDLEDYLMGLLNLASELNKNAVPRQTFRLVGEMCVVDIAFLFSSPDDACGETIFLFGYAVNAVTCGDYDRPIQISKFVAELNAGFRLLNLKNDSLRKRFDALKYDVKKIEEVVYDLTIRGLIPSQAGGENNSN